MKKTFLLLVLLTIVSFTQAKAQSFSFTMNSMENMKYDGIDLATWCPAGSIVTANVLTRSIVITKDNVEMFSGKLNNISKETNYISFDGVASDKVTKNAKIHLECYYSGKMALVVHLQNGKTFKRELKF